MTYFAVLVNNILIINSLQYQWNIKPVIAASTFRKSGADRTVRFSQQHHSSFQNQYKCQWVLYHRNFLIISSIPWTSVLVYKREITISTSKTCFDVNIAALSWTDAIVQKFWPIFSVRIVLHFSSSLKITSDQGSSGMVNPVSC